MTKEQALKLKPGDKITPNRIAYGQYTPGKIYEVQRVRNMGYGLSIKTMLDDMGNLDNGWSCENFDLAYPIIFNNTLEKLINE